MRAIVQDTYGDAHDVLRLEEVPDPTPAPGQVLVRVDAAGVDPPVWHVMAGYPQIVRLFGFGVLRPKHRIRGSDIAGEIVAVGEGVPVDRVGERTFGTGRGSFAEFATAEAADVVPIPTGTDAAHAVAGVTAGYTALQGLRRAELTAGDRVLVVGAGGGVGTVAVQLARAAGADVTALCSAGKAATVRGLGVAEVLDYAEIDVFDGTRQWDVVIDTGGARPIPRMLPALTPTGRLVVVGGEVRGFWKNAARLSAFRHSRKNGRRVVTLMADASPADLAEIAARLADGSLTTVVGATYPLAEAADAVEAWRAMRTPGRIVLEPQR